MKTWIIPVKWEMIDEIEVEANTLAEAIEIAKAQDNVSLPAGRYRDDSWKVDWDSSDIVEYIRTVYNRNQQDEKTEEFKKVIHARWEPMRSYPSEFYCSNCGEMWKDEKTPYCHECGATMDEDAGNKKD